MEYIIKTGDTLQSIAQRLLGDANRWIEIAEHNHLVYPYVSSSSSSGVVSFGDRILVNADDDTGDEQLDLSFGVDLRLSTDKVILSYNMGGDLVIGADGDYNLAEDLECLLQDTSHRMMTPYGSMPYHPSYGSRINELIGSKKDDGWRTKVSLEMSRSAKCDDRIVDIRDIQVYDIPTGAHVDYTLETQRRTFRAGEVLGNEEI